jgi:hypothetical protein
LYLFGILLSGGCGQPTSSDLGTLTVRERILHNVVHVECGSAICPWSSSATRVSGDRDLARQDLVRLVHQVVQLNPGSEAGDSMAQRIAYGGGDGRYLPWDGGEWSLRVTATDGGTFYVTIGSYPEEGGN